MNAVALLRVITWVLELCVPAAGHHLPGLPLRHLLHSLHLVPDVQRDEGKEHPSASCRRQNHMILLVTTKLLKVKSNLTCFFFFNRTKIYNKMLEIF